MNTENNLSRLSLLLAAVSNELGKVARLMNDERVKVLNLALADVRRARGFWKDGKVEGMDNAHAALVEVTERLMSAMRVRSPQDRAQLTDIAHKRLVSAMGEIEKNLAACREEVADAGA